MRIVKDIEKIQAQIKKRKPLWICLRSDAVSQMSIGWVCDLAENNMIGLPSETDLKNYDFMTVKKSVEDTVDKDSV